MNDKPVIALTVPSDIRYLNVIGACTTEICESIAGLQAESVQAVQLAVHEACVNAMEHAYCNTPKGPVKVVYVPCIRQLEVDIYEWGEGFDLATIPEPDPEDPQERGYGLMIIRGLMDEVSYHYDPIAGNHLHLAKYIGNGHG